MGHNEEHEWTIKNKKFIAEDVITHQMKKNLSFYNLVVSQAIPLVYIFLTKII